MSRSTVFLLVVCGVHLTTAVFTLNKGLVSKAGDCKNDISFYFKYRESKYYRITVDSRCTTGHKDEVYMEVSVNYTGGIESSDKYKLIVTRKQQDLERFDEDDTEELPDSMTLTFQRFGRVTVSSASRPRLDSGIWYLGATVLEKDGGVKPYQIDIRVVSDYTYKDKFWKLVGISFIGILIPVLARICFNTRALFAGFKLKKLCCLPVYWFWRGKNGTAYLVCLVAPLIFVGGFQVSHTRYVERTNITGNHDICYYNEKCFRPWTGSYDISLNGFCSNIVFIIHGFILIFHFALEEVHCRSNKHYRQPVDPDNKVPLFNYSNLYAIGLAFIGEGIGSAIYHICPSQIIFQFDTIFMFMINVMFIVALFEGHSFRDGDVTFSNLATHKSLRPVKVFAVFVGPVYLFNFIGNVLDIGEHEHRVTYHIPTWCRVLFYVAYGTWWGVLFLWTGYKLDICCRQDTTDRTGHPNLDDVETFVEHVETGECDCGYGWKLLFYIAVVAICGSFIAVMVTKVGFFSIVILGTLGIAVIISIILLFGVPVFSLSWSRCCFQILYVLLAIAISCLGVYFFLGKTTNDKTMPPEISRHQNSDCAMWDFYDYHDIWHVCISFGLMMMAMLISRVSKPCRVCYLETLGLNFEEVCKEYKGAVYRNNAATPGSSAATSKI